jgi:heme A synthase
MLDLHSVNGNLISVTTIALVVAAVLAWRPGGGPKWPIAATVVIWVLAVAQIGFGFARLLGAHFPLGMMLFGCAVALTWWTFSYRPKWTTT